MTSTNETLAALQELLGKDHDSLLLQQLAANDHKYLRDLRVNVSNTLKSSYLSAKETRLLALAVAINEKQHGLIEAFSEMAKKEGANIDEINETIACVSLLNVNNVFYRFRHFTKDEYYETTPAGIKMSIMMKPILGKEFFELMSLAVSALNGCEMCVNAHNQSVLQHGGSKERIYDAIRLTSCIKGLTALSF